MELDAITLYECAVERSNNLQREVLEFKALYLQTKSKLDSTNAELNDAKERLKQYEK
ncbi:MAG: hypothetical protein ACRCW0_06665 [Clostridium sp.]